MVVGETLNRKPPVVGGQKENGGTPTKMDRRSFGKVVGYTVGGLFGIGALHQVVTGAKETKAVIGLLNAAWNGQPGSASAGTGAEAAGRETNRTIADTFFEQMKRRAEAAAAEKPEEVSLPPARATLTAVPTRVSTATPAITPENSIIPKEMAADDYLHWGGRSFLRGLEERALNKIPEADLPQLGLTRAYVEKLNGKASNGSVERINVVVDAAHLISRVPLIGEGVNMERFVFGVRQCRDANDQPTQKGEKMLVEAVVDYGIDPYAVDSGRLKPLDDENGTFASGGTLRQDKIAEKRLQGLSPKGVDIIKFFNEPVIAAAEKETNAKLTSFRLTDAQKLVGKVVLYGV